MAFVQRAISTGAAGRASSIEFATVGTALTTLIALPLLSIAFTVVLANDLSAPDIVRVGYASALVALAVSVANGVVGRVVADRNLGVFQEVHSRRRVDFAYWLGTAFTPIVLSVVTAFFSVTGLMIVLGGLDRSAFLGFMGASVVAVFVGVCIGILAAGVGASLPDPYLPAAIMVAVLPITSGVIVPISLYPGAFRSFCMLMPLSGTVEAFTVWLDGGTIAWGLLLRDTAVAIVWAMVGALSVAVAMARIRRGLRREAL